MTVPFSLTDKYNHALATGLIDPEYHDRLLMALEDWCSKAGIPVSCIFESMSKVCDDNEVDWFKGIKSLSSNTIGLVYFGNMKAPATDRMMALTAACLRNYVDARVVSMHDIVSSLKKDIDIPGTIISIPDFVTSATKVPDWHVTMVSNFLRGRILDRKRIVLGVSSESDLNKVYGEYVSSLLCTDFLRKFGVE